MSNFTEEELEEMRKLSSVERLDKLRSIENTIADTKENLSCVRKASRDLLKDLEQRRLALIATSGSQEE